MASREAAVFFRSRLVFIESIGEQPMMQGTKARWLLKSIQPLVQGRERPA